jgi:hypothetical protein
MTQKRSSSSSSSFSGTIGTSVSAEMHGFCIYEKVVARDLGWIQVFSHLAIRRIREILVLSTASNSPHRRIAFKIFNHAFLTRPREKYFFAFTKFDIIRTRVLNLVLVGAIL